MRIGRRGVLGGLGALVAVAATPIALGGTRGYLERVLRDHFGADVMNIPGINDFVNEFAAMTGDGGGAKRIGAEVYFAWRGDRVRMIGPAAALRDRFLNTILTRSNIIAIYQGREQELDYTDIDPWEPTCGLYLSALAEDDTA